MKTLVLGASENLDRYSNRAIRSLRSHGHEVKAIGFKDGRVGDVLIQTGRPVIDQVDTVTLYLNPKNQEEYYEYILSLNPRRIIFNPGAENPLFEKMAADQGILTEEACSLVLLATGQY